MTAPGETASFRLGYVPGVTPGKWARIWAERRPDVPLELLGATTEELVDRIRNGEVDAGVVRLPIDRAGLHAIPLYTETSVVVFPKDHEFAAADELSVEDLAEHVLWQPLDDPLDWEAQPGQPPVERPETTADAIQIVAAGVGMLVVPQSLARLHHRKDLKYVPLSDAPQSRVALSFPVRDENPELIEHMIGIVRGRTVNSTRTPQRTEKKNAAQKTAAKKANQAKKPVPGNKTAPQRRRGKPRR